jgi:hypothetical protein
MFNDELHILAHACCKLSKEMHNLLQWYIIGCVNWKNQEMYLLDLKGVYEE